MPRAVDNITAIRFLQLLVTPFEKTDAYKLGVVDKDGLPLKKLSELTTQEQDAYTLLHRIVFKLKRLLAKLPAGKSMMASITAAIYLIKEDMDEDDFERQLEELSAEITDEDISFVKKLYEETGIANVAGIATPTGEADEPPGKRKQKLIRRKSISTFIKGVA